jgi:hypothetical protein
MTRLIDSELVVLCAPMMSPIADKRSITEEERCFAEVMPSRKNHDGVIGGVGENYGRRDETISLGRCGML